MWYLLRTKSKILRITICAASRNSRKRGSTNERKSFTRTVPMEHRRKTKCTSRRLMRVKVLREARHLSNRSLSTRCSSKCSELLQKVTLFLLNTILIPRKMKCRRDEMLKIDNNKKIRSTIFLRRVHVIRTARTVAKAFSTSLRPLISNQSSVKDLLQMAKTPNKLSKTCHRYH